MRQVSNITFTFEELATAEFNALEPLASPLLDNLLRNAPGFAKNPHHGIYNYDNTLGVHNLISVQENGLFVIMHDGLAFERHPLIAYLETVLPKHFSDIEFVNTP